MKVKQKNKIYFKDATHAIEGNKPSHSYGVTIFDIDGDNDCEILVANFYGDNKIYKYNEDKQIFCDIAPKNFQSKNKNTLNLCVGDFLGNGTPCVYMMHSNKPSVMDMQFDNLYARTSAKQTELQFKDLFLKQPNMTNPYSGRNVAAIDYGGTGAHAFYVLNYSTPSLFYIYNKKKDCIEELSREYGLRQSTRGRSIIAQYITNDKAIDIFIANESTTNHLFSKWSTGGIYHDIAKEANIANEYSNARGLAVADFNGNGLTDIVIGTWKESNSIFMQDKDKQFQNMSPVLFSTPRRIRNVIVADFDNDGRDELFINTSGQRNRMFRYLGENEWEELNIGPLAEKDAHGTGAAIGDLTGNGFLDIFITAGNEKPELNKLFLGVPNKNHWLRVQPMTQLGFPALGSKLRLFMKNGSSQTKFICSGGGYLCQMEPVAHFGLGSAEPEIDYLEIIWPGEGKCNPPIAKITAEYLGFDHFIQIPHPTY